MTFKSHVRTHIQSRPPGVSQRLPDTAMYRRVEGESIHECILLNDYQPKKSHLLRRYVYDISSVVAALKVLTELARGRSAPLLVPAKKGEGSVYYRMTAEVGMLPETSSLNSTTQNFKISAITHAYTSILPDAQWRA